MVELTPILVPVRVSGMTAMPAPIDMQTENAIIVTSGILGIHQVLELGGEIGIKRVLVLLAFVMSVAGVVLLFVARFATAVTLARASTHM